MRLASDQKLAYYPTSFFECYRILNLIGRPNWNSVLSNDFFKDKTAQVNDIALKIGGQGKASYEVCLQHQPDLLQSFFEMSYGYGTDPVVFLDPFAGEGEWLSLFKKMAYDKDRVITVAVEIEKNRYNTIEADYKFHSSFEACQLPKQSVNCILFNPPYGTTAGKRNVRHYFEMVVDRDLISHRGSMIMVVSESDFINCADIVLEHFTVVDLYRVHPEEFAKWGQIVVYLKKTSYPVQPHNMENEINKLKNKIATGAEFGYESYCKISYMIDSGAGFKEKYEKMQRCLRSATNYSPPDKIWDWAIDDNTTEFNEELVMPKPPKIGEICTILSSGVLSGFIDDTETPHIVAGGVKNIRKTEIEKGFDKEGKPTNHRTEIRFSRPYLNILYFKDGKPVIKEIIDGDVCEDSDDRK